MNDVFKRAVQRANDRLGRSITLVNQSAQTDASGDPQRDEYNDIQWASESTTDTTGELVYRGTPGFDRRADGIDQNIDVIAWVSDADSADITSGEDDEATRATRIEVDGERYVVRDTIDEDNGMIRAHGSEEEP